MSTLVLSSPALLANSSLVFLLFVVGQYLVLSLGLSCLVLPCLLLTSFVFLCFEPGRLVLPRVNQSPSMFFSVLSHLFCVCLALPWLVLSPFVLALLVLLSLVSSCLILFCLVMSYLVLWCFVSFYFDLSYVALSCLVLSYPVLPSGLIFLVLSCLFVFHCLALPCLVLPCLVLSCLASSYLLLLYLLLFVCLVLSCLVLSCLVLSCLSVFVSVCVSPCVSVSVCPWRILPRRLVHPTRNQSTATFSVGLLLFVCACLCVDLSCLVLSCLSLAWLASPCLALPCLALPCLVLSCLPLNHRRPEGWWDDQMLLLFYPYPSPRFQSGAYISVMCFWFRQLTAQIVLGFGVCLNVEG